MRGFSLRLAALCVCLLVSLPKLVVASTIEGSSGGNQYWNLFIQYGPVSLLGLGLTIWVITKPTLFRKYVGKATPESLGVIRVIVCGIVLAQTLWEDYASSALLPIEMRLPMGMLQLFYALPIGFDRLVSSEIGLQILKWLTVLFVFLAMIGWRTRFVLPLGAIGTFILGGILRQYDHFYHTGLVPLVLMVVLCCLPCADGWSCDRLWKIYQGKPTPIANHPSLIYGWSRYVCWVVVAQVYLAAGLSKLRIGGFLWWNATNIRSTLYADGLNSTQFDWGLSPYFTNVPDLLVALFGIFGLVSELSFPLVLFSSFARRILPFGMMMLHTGIFFLQNVPFFDLIALQLIFFDFTKMRIWVARRIARRRQPIQVLYDGLCPFCRRVIRLLDGFDLFGRLEFVNFRSLDLSEYNRSRSLNLKLTELDEEMYVISKGKSYPGFYGYRVMALALPIFWLIVPLLFFPGVDLLGKLVYGYVARNRLKLVSCDENCALQVPDENEPAVVVETRQLDSYSRLIAGLFSILMFIWFFGIDFYPFSAWQMYAENNNSGIITYYKVIAHRQSGVFDHFHLENAIGAMADGRYREVIPRCFEPNGVQLCEKFLNASATAYNRKTIPSRMVTQFEIQKWRWDFRSHPLDRQHGNLVNRFIFESKKDK